MKRYNGLDVPSGYFPDAMERLRNRYLNIPLDAVLHPVSTEVQKKVKEEKVAANTALKQEKDFFEKTAAKKRNSPLSQAKQPKEHQLVERKKKSCSCCSRVGYLGRGAYNVVCIVCGGRDSFTINEVFTDAIVSYQINCYRFLQR